ncbi:lysine-specific histone demethylase 1 [Lysobacter enzymogenes]|uniref:Lysine-specific histone demethylase 1 n=1 Tax=Lysobacter enzymogenes TaxID=69 RepID=A0A0S2DB84_LYSEN|nr:lysine-specific histone demethylase 1 [Lysobacter enzymogenes]
MVAPRPGSSPVEAARSGPDPLAAGHTRRQRPSLASPRAGFEAEAAPCGGSNVEPAAETPPPAGLHRPKARHPQGRRTSDNLEPQLAVY